MRYAFPAAQGPTRGDRDTVGSARAYERPGLRGVGGGGRRAGPARPGSGRAHRGARGWGWGPRSNQRRNDRDAPGRGVPAPRAVVPRAPFIRWRWRVGLDPVHGGGVAGNDDVLHGAGAAVPVRSPVPFRYSWTQQEATSRRRAGHRACGACGARPEVRSQHARCGLVSLWPVTCVVWPGGL